MLLKTSAFYHVPTKKSITSIINMELHKLIVLYKRVLIKFKFSCNHLWLNTQCLKLKIFPDYINRNMKNIIKSQQYKKAIFVAKITWLKAEIKKHFQIRDNTSVHLKVIHSELVSRLHPLEFDTVWRSSHDNANALSREQYLHQLKKLLRWTQPKQTSGKSKYNDKIKFYPRIVNFSPVNISPEEEKLLNNGLGYAPDLGVNNKDLVNLAVHLDAAIPKDDMEGKVKCAGIIRKNDKVNINSSSDKSVIVNFKKKVKENDLIITKADKGNSICILERGLYIQKVEDCLSKMSLKEIKEDPTKRYNKIVHAIINKSKAVLDERERHQLKVSNPSVPILYGLLKLHKDGIPIRPVSSAFNAPSQILGKKLSVLLPELLKTHNKYSIKNSLDLINRINNIKLPHYAKLVSFDVCSLFTSIPLNKLKKHIVSKINQKILNKRQSQELIDLVDLCLSQNYFYFNNKFYIQLEGLAMGASLSPFLADFYMNVIEDELFTNDYILTEKILCWYRYVDDIFCVWTGSKRQLQVFLNSVLNKIDDNIKFTIEYGGDKLNFLDISISIRNNMFEYDIFRKLTYTDTTIPFSSQHPDNIKRSAFHSMLDRLINIPLNYENYKKELSTIIQIAVMNGYPKSFIYKLLRSKNRKYAFRLAYPDVDLDKNKAWRKIPYIKGISEKMRPVLDKHNIQPAYFTNNTLNKLILNNKLKPIQAKIEKSGVYSIECNDCNAVYIGKSKRSIKTRFVEHISAAKNKRAISGLSKHLIDSGHTTSIDKLKLLCNINGGKILDRYEILKIKEQKEKGSLLVNDQIDFAYSSPLIRSNFRKH